MTITATWGRSARIGNETALSGNQTLSQEIGTSISQPIAIGADDAVVAFAGTKENIRGMAFIADQDLTLKLGGGPYTVAEFTVLGDTETNVGGEFTIAGADLTAWIWPGDLFWIQGSTSDENNGLYCVLEANFAALLNTIEVIQVGAAGIVAGPDLHMLGTINVAATNIFQNLEVGAGAANVAYKIQPLSAKIDIGAGDNFTNVGPPGDNLVVAGDFSFLQADDQILVLEATDEDNCQIHRVVTATFAAPDTTIVVEGTMVTEAGSVIAYFQHVRSELIIHLNANQPFLWSEDSGVPSPLLDDVTQILATNASGVAATLQGRIIGDSP